jgi:hypothetical protein
MADDPLIVAGVEVGSGLLGERARSRGIAIGDGQKLHRRMLGRDPRAQCADAPGAHDCNAEVAMLHAHASTPVKTKSLPVISFSKRAAL